MPKISRNINDTVQNKMNIDEQPYCKKEELERQTFFPQPFTSNQCLTARGMGILRCPGGGQGGICTWPASICTHFILCLVSDLLHFALKSCKSCQKNYFTISELQMLAMFEYVQAVFERGVCLLPAMLEWGSDCNLFSGTAHGSSPLQLGLANRNRWESAAPIFAVVVS
jgi:hypothetical protein